MQTAVIIPWRKGETELQTTIDSASKSIGKGVIMPIEDVEGQGPGRTRDRGIMAATDADVIVIVDAHMKFKGKVLERMAKKVRQDSGLECAICHHNEGCEFNKLHPSGHGAYYGADIHYKGSDANGNNALLWKWQDTRLSAGPVACIGGACYVFRRDWYLSVGRPLSILPCWGGDEEVLSMAAWYSGFQPNVFDGHVAHRWRPAAPWRTADPEVILDVKYRCRAAIITAFVHDRHDADDLLMWQGGAHRIENEAVRRTREALLKQPRTWAQWKKAVPIMARKAEVKIKVSKEVGEKIMKKRANYGSAENRRTCQKCESTESNVQSIRRTDRLVIRYRVCSKCGTRRATQEVLA
jgi:hypothetical protein